MSNLYGKYIVTKRDGTPTDPDAEYFVLRIDTDPAARAALNAYADYITFSDPKFSDDLRMLLELVPLKPATGRE